MSHRSAEEALAAAVRECVKPSRNDKGMCLRSVRTLLNVPARDPSARLAWDATPKDERHRLPAPAGVPVFWKVGKHGHVALSAGHGLCWSVDIIRPGRIDPVPIVVISRRWGAEVLGWTATLNGVRLL